MDQNRLLCSVGDLRVRDPLVLLLSMEEGGGEEALWLLYSMVYKTDLCFWVLRLFYIYLAWFVEFRELLEFVEFCLGFVCFFVGFISSLVFLAGSETTAPRFLPRLGVQPVMRIVDWRKATKGPLSPRYSSCVTGVLHPVSAPLPSLWLSGFEYSCSDGFVRLSDLE